MWWGKEKSRIWSFQFESLGEGPRNPMMGQVWKPRTVVPNFLIRTTLETL